VILTKCVHLLVTSQQSSRNIIRVTIRENEMDVECVTCGQKFMWANLDDRDRMNKWEGNIKMDLEARIEGRGFN